MAGTTGDSQRPRPGRRRWRKSIQRLSRRLLCCACLKAEERDPLPGQEERNDGDHRPPGPDRGVSVGMEAIQITVEDLGVVNPNFSLSAGESPDQRSSMGRSASSVSACPRALEKRPLKALTSFPIHLRAEWIGSVPNEDDQDEKDKEDPVPLERGTVSPPASGSLLTPPVINLIPPTPSDVIDDDQFFDINSEEESVAHASGSEGSYATGDQESYEERMESVEPEEAKKEGELAESQFIDDKNEPGGGQDNESREEGEAVPVKEEEEKPKRRFLHSAYQVAPLPEYPRKRSFNTGINLLSFTEHNLDDLSSKDVSSPELMKAELRLLPHTAKMESYIHTRKPATGSCSVGAKVTRSHTFHVITQATDPDQGEDGSPRQRRITVASYMPHIKDQNGNFAEKELDRQGAKSLGELNTDEVCQWFSSIGLKKCLPFIREAELCGADIASVDMKTLDILHISALEDRETLLSAIYKRLHPPSTTTQRIDSLLETFGPNNVERFTAALVTMSKSKSSPYVSCLNTNRCSLKLRSKSQNYMAPRNFQLIEITINASEQIVHLRTPKDTTVGKVMESCIKMLGMTEERDLFTLKHKQGSPEELSVDQQIGSLLTSASENTQLELHLCKKEKPKCVDVPKVTGCPENGSGNQDPQVTQPAKEDKIKELNQQVDSLQNVILQVQELHHGLVAFCSELKSMDGEMDVAGLGSAELEHRLELVQSRLRDKRQNLQALRDNVSNAAAHRNKRLEVRLLEKMKLNCQVFKEEISLVHLNRQVAHLHNALQDCHVKEKTQRKCSVLGSLSQLVSPQCPAMLLVVQESLGPDGHYGFTCRLREGSGLVVVQVENCHLCLDDRLVEVNGVPVVGCSEEDLNALLLQGPSAQIVVLRRPPPPTPASSPDSQHQHPLPLPLPLLEHTVNPEPVHTRGDTETDATAPTDITPQRELMAI